MKNGPKRFDYYLSRLQVLLNKSSKQKNPALWLYQNNARTTLFMLEGLAKMYSGMHNKKMFAKLDMQFKLLEDILGAIDYYDCFAKQFIAGKKMPANITGYLQAQTREKIQSLNEVLKEKGWLSENNRRMTKIREKLAGADWMNEKEEVGKILQYYKKYIAAIIAFTGKTDFHFENVEADVHELRRKLRWLSIYPQALRGSIQLSKSRTKEKHLAKYLTKDITGSPFNVMPDAADNKYFLLFDQNYFYALSWMIARLGEIKDSGLKVIIIKEALQQLASTSDPVAFKKAYALAGKGQPHIKQLLDTADAVCKTYFKEKNLDKMIIGIGGVKH